MIQAMPVTRRVYNGDAVRSKAFSVLSREGVALKVHLRVVVGHRGGSEEIFCLQAAAVTKLNLHDIQQLTITSKWKSSSACSLTNQLANTWQSRRKRAHSDISCTSWGTQCM